MKNKKTNFLINCMLYIIGSFIYCLAVNNFIVPVNLYSGGFIGIAQLLTIPINYLITTNINMQGIIYFILNIPLFIIGIKKLGKRMIGKSFIIIILESIFLSIIPIPKHP